MADRFIKKEVGCRKQRIFVGLTEIADLAASYAKAFDAIGYTTYTVVREKNPYFLHEKYDVVIADKLRWIDNRHFPLNLIYMFLRELLVFIQFFKVLATCDTFIFIFGSSFFWGETYFDYPILKLFGKKIVSVFCGCDIRHWSAHIQEFAFLRLNISFESACINCNMRSQCCLTKKLKTVYAAEKYSDLILSQRSISQLMTQPYMRAAFPMVLNEYDFQLHTRDIPKIVHASTNRSLKRTDYILDVIRNLRNSGIKFEFQLIEKTDNQELRRILSDSDIAIIFVAEPTLSMFTVEAMATGNVVLGGGDYGYDIIPNNCPVITVNRINLYDKLKQVIINKDLRMKLGRAGREYVETNYSHIAVAKQILSWLELDGINRHDYYPNFAKKHFRIPIHILKKERCYRTKEIIHFLRR